MLEGRRNKESASLKTFRDLSLKQRLRLRHHLLDALRSCFATSGYLEVETPLMVPCPGIDPYIDAFSAGETSFLSTSPELHMKRLMAEGFEKIFQITKAFRAHENGPFHNSEFTILEWYAAGRNYHALMKETENLVHHTGKVLEEYSFDIPITRWPSPFPRLSVDEVFKKYAGWSPSEYFDADRFFIDLLEKVEPHLEEMGAVFVYDFPASAGGFARRKPGSPKVVERFELYLNGIEICNGYSELVDHHEQSERFDLFNRARQDMGKIMHPVDTRFLGALKKGLPSCAGNALGVDRLMMALTGTRHISDTMSFPSEQA